MRKEPKRRGGHAPRPVPTLETLSTYAKQRTVFEQIDAMRPPTKLERAAPIKNSPAMRDAVLVVLRKGHTIKVACDAIGIDRSTLLSWRDADPDYEKAVQLAIDEGTDYFEEEARRRAVEGIDRPVFQMGQVVGFTREYSDSLLAMQMKGRRPERYSDKMAHTGPNGSGPVEHHVEVEFVKPKGE